MDQPLDIQRRGPVAWLTLNRPDDANSIDAALARALLNAANQIAADDSARAVVITGAGRMFCAGGDIKAFLSGDDPAAAIDAITTPLHAALRCLAEIDKPVLTLVNGPAAGAGFGLAIAGDLVIAARSAHFTSAYTAIGLTPDGGTSWLLPRLIGLRRATELVLTNRRVGSEEAERIGLVSSVVDDPNLMTEGSKIAERLAAGAVGAMGRSRRLLSEGLIRDFGEHLECEARAIAESAAGEEGRRGITAFLERRERSSRPA
jgi:2-(1,2-epoxy-1,2-dihydrophenyl)acetyl-CoA isomerase